MLGSLKVAGDRTVMDKYPYHFLSLPFFVMEVKFTHKIIHLKVKNSEAFSTLTTLCNHHFCLVLKHSYHPKGKLVHAK